MTSVFIMMRMSSALTSSQQVEDLFYNMQTRRAAFKNLNDQYRAILDVVTRYAVHFGSQGISFTCRKVGASDVRYFVDVWGGGKGPKKHLRPV